MIFLYLDENGSVWEEEEIANGSLVLNGGWSVQSKHILSDAHDISVGWNFSLLD